MKIVSQRTKFKCLTLRYHTKQSSTMFNPSQSLFSFLKDAWMHGKRVPVLSRLLDLVEGVLNKTTGADFLLIEHQLYPQLKNFDDMLEPAIGSCCQFVETALVKIQSAAEPLIKSSFRTQDDTVICLNTSANLEELLIEDALAFQKPLGMNEDNPTPRSESPHSKTNIPHKKTESKKHARLSFLSPKRGSKSRRKSKKRSSKVYRGETESKAATISPVKSELGETKLIKEAIMYFSNEDFIDSGDKSAAAF